MTHPRSHSQFVFYLGLISEASAWIKFYKIILNTFYVSRLLKDANIKKTLFTLEHTLK